MAVLGVAFSHVQAQELIEVDQEALQERIADGEMVTVVNFWATWCGPCREEFPDFVQLGHDFADDGVEVLFVSMDFPDEQDAVRAFLDEQGWEQPSYLRVGKDNAFIKAMHDEWTGVLPATLIYSREGTLVHFSQGSPLDYDALVEHVRPHL
jgi:thiol-disulfide isomerase/thioredoxin